MADDPKNNTFKERFPEASEFMPAKPAWLDDAARYPLTPPPVTPMERLQYTTVIDPGHGDFVPLNNGKSAGYDPGSVRELPPAEAGAKPKKVEERGLNLPLSNDVKTYLTKRGAGITLTHEGLDFQIDGQPHEKAEYNLHRTAINRDAGAFVSIHHDSGNPKRQGVVIHYNQDSAVSAKYAKVLAAAIGSKLKEKVEIHADDRDLGVLQRDRHMRFDGTEQPAVLIEAANMNHDKDLARVLDANTRRKLADSIGAGILTAQTAIDGPIARIVDPGEKVPLPRSRPREI